MENFISSHFLLVYFEEVADDLSWTTNTSGNLAE